MVVGFASGAMHMPREDHAKFVVCPPDRDRSWRKAMISQETASEFEAGTRQDEGLVRGVTGKIRGADRMLTSKDEIVISDCECPGIQSRVMKAARGWDK